MRELLKASAVALGMAAMASACRDQVSAPPPSPAGSSYVTETVVTPSPTPTKPMPTGASAVLAAAPELTPESARMLVEISPGASVDVVVRTSLLEATHGFPYLSPNELRGLGALFAKAYAHLTVDDRGRLESYLQRVRGGCSTLRSSRCPRTIVNGFRLSMSARSPPAWRQNAPRRGPLPSLCRSASPRRGRR